MPVAISAAEANREFSKLLRRVREGESITIMSHGRPVAKLVPAGAEDRVRAAARKALLEHLRSQKGGKPIGRWTREELYERE